MYGSPGLESHQSPVDSAGWISNRTFDTPHLHRQLAKVALQMVKDLLRSCFNGLDLRRHSPLDGLDLRQSPSL